MTGPGGPRAGGRPVALVTGAARGIGRAAALALARAGYDVVAPGWMEGDWMRARLGDNYQRLMQRRARTTPLGRCVTAEDVAGTIVSLVVSKPFATGEVMVVDGGYSATT